jgi:hypothetical protein
MRVIEIAKHQRPLTSRRARADMRTRRMPLPAGLWLLLLLLPVVELLLVEAGDVSGAGDEERLLLSPSNASVLLPC